MSVPEGRIEVTAATPAAEIPNARAYIVVATTAAATDNADDAADTVRKAVRAENGRGRSAFSRKNARGLVDGSGGRGGGGGGGGPIAVRPAGAAVAQLCKSLIVRGACGDPACTKRHATNVEELLEVRA